MAAGQLLLAGVVFPACSHTHSHISAPRGPFLKVFSCFFTGITRFYWCQLGEKIMALLFFFLTWRHHGATVGGTLGAVKQVMLCKTQSNDFAKLWGTMGVLLPSAAVVKHGWMLETPGWERTSLNLTCAVSVSSSSALMSLPSLRATSGRSVRWQASVGRWQRISLCDTDIDHNFTPFQLSLLLPPLLFLSLLSSSSQFSRLDSVLLPYPPNWYQSQGCRARLLLFFILVKAFGPMTCHIHSLLIGVA